MTKPKTLTLVKIETPDWKKTFELEVKAVTKGSSLVLPMSPDQARALAIIHWMRHGDLKPLAAEIAEGKVVLDPGIGRALRDLIAEGRVSVRKVSGSRGAGKQPGLLSRKVRMISAYEEQRARLGSSQEAFKKVADDFRVSVETVREAVTQMRKLAAEDNT